MGYTTYNAIALIGGATRALDSFSVAKLNDGDRAVVMDSSDNLLLFKFDDDSTLAENVIVHPYRVRPDDYSDEGQGVWLEQISPLVTNQVNLLTNSGFGVWSNSALAQGADQGRQSGYEVGSALVTGTDADFSGAGNWVEGTNWNIVSGVMRASPAASSSVYLALSGLTVGKLYKFKINCDDYTSGTRTMGVKNAAGSTWIAILTTTPVTGQDESVIWEATETNNRIYISGGSLIADYDDADVHEVTPACFGVDGLGPDGWYKNDTLDLERQHNDGGTLTKDGSFYSLMSTPSAQDDFFYCFTGRVLLVEHYQKFAGRTITLGAWVKSSTASDFRLSIADTSWASRESAGHYSDYHTGGGAWEWLEVTHTCDASSTDRMVPVFEHKNASPGVAHISQPMLIFGDYIGEGNYIQPLNEYIPFEAVKQLTSWGPMALSDVGATTAINLENESDGVIPQGVKSIHLLVIVQDEDATGGWYVSLYGYDVNTAVFVVDTLPAVDKYNSNNGIIPCDANGDIGYRADASGGSTLDVIIRVYGVIV